MHRLTKAKRLTRLFFDFQRRRAKAGGLPCRIWIETASCCNLRCVMCPNKELAASRKGLMSLDLFRRIIDECRSFVSNVYLHHRDEPLLAIWNGAAHQKLRQQLTDDLQALALCRKCDRLCRQTVAGLPLQYMTTFLIDHILSYGKLRKLLGTQERN